MDTGLGEAVRWDSAQHIINPDPSYEYEMREGGSGEHASRAIGRYNNDQIKQPVTIGTSSSASSSSSSSSTGPK